QAAVGAEMLGDDPGIEDGFERIVVALGRAAVVTFSGLGESDGIDPSVGRLGRGIGECASGFTTAQGAAARGRGPGDACAGNRRSALGRNSVMTGTASAADARDRRVSTSSPSAGVAG